MKIWLKLNNNGHFVNLYIIFIRFLYICFQMKQLLFKKY